MIVSYTALVLVVVCGLAGGGDALLADEQKEEILKAHNHYRAHVNPVASNMAKLEWDDELSLLAQFSAVSCKLKSNENRHEQSSLFDYVGEIMAASVNSTVNLTAMVEEWYAQGVYFNYSTASCEDSDGNGVNKDDKDKENSCGKYIQLVWASTHKVGCGTYRCEEIKGLDVEVDEDIGVMMMICYYGPGGGYVDELPYENGEGVCTTCPVYLPYCVENLCSATGGAAATHSAMVIPIATLVLFTAALSSLFHFPG